MFYTQRKLLLFSAIIFIILCLSGVYGKEKSPAVDSDKELLEADSTNKRVTKEEYERCTFHCTHIALAQANVTNCDPVDFTDRFYHCACHDEHFDSRFRQCVKFRYQDIKRNVPKAVETARNMCFQQTTRFCGVIARDCSREKSSNSYVKISGGKEREVCCKNSPEFPCKPLPDNFQDTKAQKEAKSKKEKAKSKKLKRKEAKAKSQKSKIQKRE